MVAAWLAYIAVWIGHDSDAYSLFGLAFLILVVIVPSLYWVLFWSRLGRGRTPGMRIAGIRVIDRDGQPPSVRAAALRFAVLVVLMFPVALWPIGIRDTDRALYQIIENSQMMAFLILLGTVAFSSGHRGIHDRLAGTTVVYDDEPRSRAVRIVE